MEDRTTIQIKREVREALKKRKKYPRETYGDLLERELKLDIKKMKQDKGGL